ncbi:hypothetical protein MTO96_033643 [Rhipicephalus appendiculatus]
MSTASEKQRSPAHRQDTKTARMEQPRQQSEPEPTVSAPPRAKVQQRSVATWTHQDRQEAPKFFGARLPDPPGVRECALCGVNVYSRSHYKGSLHVAKAKAARGGGRPTSSAPPAAALPDKDLAAMCRERLQENPNFAALVGPVFQAATASTASADGETREDVLIDFESFI